MFHHNCINQSINTNHLDCPECRTPITKVTNIDKLLEIVIRNEAFDHGYIDANMKHMFETNSVIVEDYPYHKLVFELWTNEKRI